MIMHVRTVCKFLFFSNFLRALRAATNSKLKQQLAFVATAYNRTLSESNENTPIFFVSVNPKTANEIYAQVMLYCSLIVIETILW